MGGSMGGSMGRNPSSSMDVRRSMMNEMRERGDQRGINSSNNLDDLSNPFGANFDSRMSSNQKMNSDSDFRSGLVIGGGRGRFDPGEDSIGGGNSGRSSISRREAFGGSGFERDRGLKQSFGGGRDGGGGSWGGRTRGGGGHSTWSS